jgi:hypothetical protein
MSKQISSHKLHFCRRINGNFSKVFDFFIEIILIVFLIFTGLLRRTERLGTPRNDTVICNS